MHTHAHALADQRHRRHRPQQQQQQPKFFYQSPSAIIDGDVRFSEGCVVLPGARVRVPRGYRLCVGPCCIFDDLSELLLDCPGAASLPLPPQQHQQQQQPPPVTILMGSHNWVHSYARVHVQLPPPPPPPLSALAVEHQQQQQQQQKNAAVWRLMDDVNVVGPFATVHASLLAREGRPLGSFNFIAPHTSFAVHLACGAPHAEEAVAPSLRPATSPPPVAPPPLQHTTTTTTTTTPLQSGRVSVEERLFKDEDGDDDEDDDAATHARPRRHRRPTASPPLLSQPRCAQQRGDEERDEEEEEEGDGRVEEDGACEHMVVLSRPRDNDDGGGGGGGDVGAAPLILSRFGVRSTTELPVAVMRIVDETRAVDNSGGGDDNLRRAVSPSAGANVIPNTTTATAAAASALLARCVRDVHPELRTHEEARLRREAERVCRLYIHRYIDDCGLRQVDSTLGDANA
ncbi:hypothetical protein NESM_000401700 [Novymonas esmeraldas]|uniref:Uncharacterized protein n=1 Tax=Novymonas esmeraldas TaxID=1808958 RepID=A0AAW0EL13_9TRYP